MLHLLQYDLFLQFNDGRKNRAVQRIADPKAILPLFQDPGRGALVKGRQLLDWDLNGQNRVLAGLKKRRLGKGHQTAALLWQTPLRTGCIDLEGFFSRKHTDVGHTGSQTKAVKHDVGDRKACIGKPMPEAIEGLYAEGIKIAIAHIDSLGIVLLCHISVQIGEALCVGIVRITSSPGSRQFSRRIDAP